MSRQDSQQLQRKRLLDQKKAYVNSATRIKSDMDQAKANIKKIEKLIESRQEVVNKIKNGQFRAASHPEFKTNFSKLWSLRDKVLATPPGKERDKALAEFKKMKSSFTNEQQLEFLSQVQYVDKMNISGLRREISELNESIQVNRKLLVYNIEQAEKCEQKLKSSQPAAKLKAAKTTASSISPSVGAKPTVTHTEPKNLKEKYDAKIKKMKEKHQGLMKKVSQENDKILTQAQKTKKMYKALKGHKTPSATGQVQRPTKRPHWRP